VFSVIIDGISFKAFQLFRRVQRRFDPFACPSLKQPKQLFHESVVVHHGFSCQVTPVVSMVVPRMDIHTLLLSFFHYKTSGN